MSVLKNCPAAFQWPDNLSYRCSIAGIQRPSQGRKPRIEPICEIEKRQIFHPQLQLITPLLLKFPPSTNKNKYIYIYILPDPQPAPPPMPERSQKPSCEKQQIKTMNFDFRKRPLDLLCSNVKGGAFSSGNSILMQRERDQKRDKSKKKQRFGRAAKSVGSGCGSRVGVQSRVAVQSELSGLSSLSGAVSSELSGLSCLV